MITTRLNTLIKAYRIACQQVGDANRGKALPGVCLRRCHKLRQIIWPEIRRVAWLLKLISARRARKQEKQTMANEIGESLGAVYSRADDLVMTRVITALQEGGRLHIDKFIRKAVVEGLPDRDSRNGTTITLTRLRKLVEKGVVHETALDRYTLVDGFDLQA